MAERRFHKVAVLYGGASSEREVSLRSGSAVCQGLLKAGINAHLFDPAVQALHQLPQEGFDCAFIALHGRGGEDGMVQGALEWLDIPYTGSRVLGSALGMDKVRCKQIWQSEGLPTAPYCVVRQPIDIDRATRILDELGTVIVKPVHEGSSIGMAKATTAEDLLQATNYALTLDQDVLVERWINGDEYTVSIVGNRALPAIQMKTPHVFYDYEAKYQSDTTQYFCPCDLPDDVEYELQKLSLAAFHAVGCEGWGRVDLMRDAGGRFCLLEVNTVPGMTETSLVPKAAAAKGISFSELVVQILEMAH